MLSGRSGGALLCTNGEPGVGTKQQAGERGSGASLFKRPGWRMDSRSRLGNFALLRKRGGFCHFSCVPDLMGQIAGRLKKIRMFKPEEYESMTVEVKEEKCQTMSKCDEKKCTKDVLEKHNQLLKAICGMADSNNEAVGLYNIGLNCCLNSLLQVFFMNRHFTVILRRIKVPFEASEQKMSVPYQMLLLLEQMQHCKEKSVHPKALACCLTKHNVQLFVQYDAAQLLLKLWNLIKAQITNGDLVESLSLLYNIQLEESLVCQKCSLEIKKASNMLMLPLPIFDVHFQDIKTLEHSLCYLFEPELLTEENACFCQQCGRKTPWMKGMKLTSLPQTLTLHLKRFCTREGGRTRKINHYLTFPLNLDFSKILTPEQYQPNAQEDGLYELFAVVAHSGTSTFGHYCAYIWSLTKKKWYCFNDSSVCQVSWDDVRCTYGKASLRWGETAYLLVYMKVNGKEL